MTVVCTEFCEAFRYPIKHNKTPDFLFNVMFIEAMKNFSSFANEMILYVVLPEWSFIHRICPFLSLNPKFLPPINMFFKIILFSINTDKARKLDFEEII